MSTIGTIKNELSEIISKANAKTGNADTTVSAAVNTLINGYGKGEEPTGTIQITANGIYDVTSYAQANVDVAASGGDKQGLNARIFTATVSSDVTSGDYTILGANEFLSSIRTNPKAFVWMWCENPPVSTAMYSTWLNANFPFGTTGSTQRNTVLVRTSTSSNNVTLNSNGVAGVNYSGHMSVESNGSIKIRGCNATYPVKAGTYKIVAGTVEMV